MSYTHRLRVRYGECDMQHVVFNAHYWTYCDDAVDVWVRRALALEMGVPSEAVVLERIGFDFMLKSCTGTWHRGVRFGESPSLLCSVERWGNTSFEVRVDLRVQDETRFEATLVYVSVDPVSRGPVPTPDRVRAALSRPVERQPS